MSHQRRHKVAELCRLQSSLISKVNDVGILDELLNSLSNFFMDSTDERYTVRPEAFDSELDTALLIVDNILSYISFMKIRVSNLYQNKINDVVHSLKIKVTAMTSRLRFTTSYTISRYQNILTILNELRSYPSIPRFSNNMSEETESGELDEVVVIPTKEEETNQSSPQSMLLGEIYSLLWQATAGTDPVRIVTDLDDLTGRLIRNELSVSSVYVTVLVIQSIIDHLSVTDTDFSRNGHFDNTIVWIENSKKFITKYIDHFDPFARNHIIKCFDYILLMIETLQSFDNVIYFLPEEEDLKDFDSCPDKLKLKINRLSSVTELDEILRTEYCNICFRTVDPNNYIVQDVCEHYFCRTCIEPWFRNRNTCPTCRASCDHFTSRAAICDHFRRKAARPLYRNSGVMQPLALIAVVLFLIIVSQIIYFNIL